MSSWVSQDPDPRPVLRRLHARPVWRGGGRMAHLVLRTPSEARLSGCAELTPALAREEGAGVTPSPGRGDGDKALRLSEWWHWDREGPAVSTLPRALNWAGPQGAGLLNLAEATGRVPASGALSSLPSCRPS